MSTTTLLPLQERARAAAPAQPAHRPRLSPWWLVAALAALQCALAYRPGYNERAFIDEGLYVYMGHRMLDHLLDGSFLHEYPGSFFSGAPGFYPVLAALGDSVAGLQGARAVSLIGAVGAMACVFGLARALFGAVAGVTAAAVFAIAGPVVYQSHLAVYDSWSMMMFASAAWLAASSARRDGFAAAPIVGLLLSAAFFAKYAGAAYAPVVAALAVGAGWPLWRWVVVRRAVSALVTAVVATLFVLVLWGHSLWPGIESTTADRTILIPATPGHLVSQVIEWVGLPLALAVFGGVVQVFKDRRDALLVLVLLGGSVVGIVQQVRIGDSTSLNKHLAFGLVFAAPLIGVLAQHIVSNARRAALPAAVAGGALVALLGVHAVNGLQDSQKWLTGWVEDAPLLPVLRDAIALNPDKVILAEEGAPQRYALTKEGVLKPRQYNDTYQLQYGGARGIEAYKKAVDDTHYGVIYLTLGTENGRWLHDYLLNNDTPYRQVAQPDRILRGQQVGKWLVYVPKVSDR